MAIISTLSGTVKYSIFCFLFLLMGIIRFMPFLTYYRNHKKWVCRMADPFAHFLFSCKRTVVVPCAFSLCELPREWDTTGCFRIFSLFSDSFPRVWDKNGRITAMALSIFGSFPPTWGKLPKPFHGADTMRLIPTRVG